MSEYSYLLAALFLPLFPLSMPFNFLFARLRNPLLRSALLLGWPHIGLMLITGMSDHMPDWLAHWAVLTALLYALRALSIRELGVWTGFIATSAWALLWIVLASDSEMSLVHLYALGFGIPLALLSMLGNGLEQRFSAAFAGLQGGLAQSMPRFAGVLVPVVLAVIATPLFPAFFALLAVMLHTAPTAPLLATGVAVVWLLWSWAGARMLQALIVGPPPEAPVADLGVAITWGYVITLGSLVIAGLYTVTGGLL